MKIGIIGCGFVGSAILSAYTRAGIQCVIRDPAKGYDASYNDLKKCQAIFIAVPSPQLPSGQCDSTILEVVIDELRDYKGYIISKVTAPPDVYRRLEAKCINFCYSPEFLTAVNANNDYYNATFLIVGGREDIIPAVENIIRQSQPHVTEVRHCGVAEASATKYLINTFLSTKVIFMNEFKQLCDAHMIDYDMVRHAASLDTRFGISHTQVPGPDGQFGFGGACFPKDTAALSFFATNTSVSLSVLDAAINKNNILKGSSH